jgi:transposase
MSKVTVFVGLDYHQGAVQVCVMDRKGDMLINATRGNDWREVVQTVPRKARVFAAIEACCGAADLADELIEQAGWSVHLAHPGYVARIKQSPDKTDFSDARLLADLERVGYLPKVWLAPKHVRELRKLVRLRAQLVEERRRTKSRVRALLRDERVVGPPEINPWTKAWLEWARQCDELGEDTRWILGEHLAKLDDLQVAIRRTERRLKERTQDDKIVQKLLEQEGVGLVTATTLRAEIGRFDRFRTGKQLARFCSVTPRNASSGARQADAGLIRAGNPELRRVLIETACRLKWQSDHWSDFNERMKERGKAPCVVTAAIANRWIRALYYEMRYTVA